jgi:superfamily I DNA and RNA helicase
VEAILAETWWVRPEQLDDDQRRVIGLPIGGSHLITGPPGSGKSNLLLLRASYVRRAGRPNLIVLVFTRTLQEFMRAGVSTYDIPSERISTFRRWKKRFLAEHNMTVDLPPDFDESRRVLNTAVIDVIHKRHLKNVYDCILLDEAQDYLPEEMEIVCLLARDVYAAADGEQKIYRGKDPLPLLIAQKEPQTHRLRFHYRNGYKICRFADAIASDSGSHVSITSTSNYDEDANPSTVTAYSAGTLQEQIANAASQIERQLRVFPDEMIGVLCPRVDQAVAAYEQLAELYGEGCLLQTAERGYSPFAESTRVCVSTIHSAKGLEYRAVHVIGTEALQDFSYRRNVAYTAATRAKTSLSIHHSGALPDFIEGALADIGPRPQLPRLGDLFGVKS